MELGALLDDRFELEQQIGSGGMGMVFRARDRTAGETVAVKVISEDHEHRTERFEREIEVLAELTHPGIVRHIAHGVMASGAPFLVMEWLEGEDLKHRLARAPLTPGESIQLATRVAEALGAAHERGIIHRDLKPSNIFLPGGIIEQVKVLDFGMARREGRASITRTNAMIGTLGYMAPEQVRAGGAIDARADVFALGCVLFRCLTGTPAFDGDSPASILGQILFGEAPRVNERWPDGAQDLDALVSRMMSRDPALRPSNGAHLATALAALGPLARSASVGVRPRRAPSSPLTGSERRFLSVVLLEAATEDDAAAEEALRRACQPHGRLEQLAGGSTIVVLDPDGEVATDLAAQAARCALAMRMIAGSRRLAIAMGRAGATSARWHGDAIDRASRLLSHLSRSSGDLPPIALDEMIAGLLDARFDVTETEAGLMLHGERPLLQGARTLLGRPTSCVGRDWELTALAGILDDCIKEPSAQVVVVTAAAGIGKSRLAAEFARHVRDRAEPIAIWMGRGDSLRAGSTLDLLAQALRGALGIRDGAPLAERCDQIRARVAERLPPAQQTRVTEFLGELVGASFGNGGNGGDASAQLGAARGDSSIMSEQMAKAWMDFLDAETAVHPVLLVLEDLHWGDLGTVRFIDAALRSRSQRPWMVLALARPEVFEVFPKLWEDRQHVQEIRLKELGRRAGERLVRQVLGDTVGPDTVERLVKLADGNTFYLEELIRSIAEGKDKAGSLPETVLAMVETRLARLSVEARGILRAASVFGEVCWDGGLGVVMDGIMEPAVANEWLARLIEQEMLVLRPHGRFPGHREIAFRHTLLHEGAYATLTDEDRQRSHLLAGEWLEQNGERDPMVLAGHFERGGQSERAATYYLRATEQALLIRDLPATMARVRLGLGCAPPEEIRIRLLGLRCDAASTGLQMIAGVMPDAEELLRVAPRGSVPWLQAMLAYLQYMLVTHRIEDFMAALEVLRAVEPAPNAAGKIALTYLVGVFTLDNIGQVPMGTALAKRFTEIILQSGEHEQTARFWWNFALGMRAFNAHEDPWRTFQHCDALEAICATIGGGGVYAMIQQLVRGLSCWCLGAPAAAERELDGIASADASLGIGSSLRRFALSWMLADRGELSEARAIATRLSEDGHAHHNLLEESRGRWVLAEVLRRAGELDAAERELQTALAMAVPLEQPGVRATLALLRLAQRRPEDALAAAEDALAHATAIGACGLFRGAFVRLARAEVLHATGDLDAARRAIASARDRLIQIAATIADPAYRTSFLEVVPENARTLAFARAWLRDGDLAG